MRLGIHFANLTFPGGPGELATTLAETARAADEGGAAWFTLMDHWFQMEQLGGPRTSRCSRATPRSASSPAQTEPHARWACWSPA